jgi:hypothetical protein
MYSLRVSLPPPPRPNPPQPKILWRTCSVIHELLLILYKTKYFALNS